MGYQSPVEEFAKGAARTAPAATPEAAAEAPPPRTGPAFDDFGFSGGAEAEPASDAQELAMETLLKSMVGGGASAAATPKIASGATKAARWTTDQIGLTQPPPPGEAAALEKIAKALQDDQITPKEARLRLRDAAPKTLSLLDAAGKNVVTLGRDVVGQPGPARELAGKVLENRQASAPDRILDDVRSLVSPSTDFYGTAQGLSDSRRDAAKVLYDKAMDAGGHPTPRILRLMNTHTGQIAVKEAIRIASDEGIDLSKTFLTDPAFGKVASPKENMKVLHYFKMGVDSAMEDRMGEDPLYGDPKHTTASRAIDKNIRQPLMQQMDQINPDYKAARQSYSSHSDSMDALAKGRRFALQDAEINARDLAGMSPGDQELFRVGVARGLKDRIYNTADGADAVKAIFGNPKKREVLSTAFGDPKLFDEFSTRMGQEATMFKNRNVVMNGTQTAEKLQDAAFNSLDPAFLARIFRGDFTGAAGQVAKSVIGRARGLDKNVREKLGEKLFDPTQATKTLRQIEEAGRQAVMRSARMRRLAPIGAAVGAAGTAALNYLNNQDSEEDDQ